MFLSKRRFLIFILTFFLLFYVVSFANSEDVNHEEKLLPAMHSISSHTLYNYVKELCKEEYSGRLTGTKGYNKAAKWVAEKFKNWNIKPGGDNNSYLQVFKNPYTKVYKGCKLSLSIPIKKGEIIKKNYIYEKDFHPGATSGNGEITAEVIYVGYGITAPELGYDDYKGVDVRGKIVMMEREVPVSTEDTKKFKKWRPYSFHQYKVKNAKKHGAAGMLYVYHIANPNCLYIKDLILTYIGDNVVKDIFLGTGYEHKEVVKKIKNTLKPQSFNTGKIVTIKNNTKHFPDGIAYNVIGYIEGVDSELKDEPIIIGAHLDHLGKNYKLMPGANDNASGVSVVLGVAKALAESKIETKRSIVFILFGAEEQGVKGSEYYVKNPLFPNNKVKYFINMDGVGRGNKIYATAAENFPELWNYFEKANKNYIHRIIKTNYFKNIARPRLDAARFLWEKIPAVSLSAYGASSLPYKLYHKTTDKPGIITPEILEDIAQLVFISVVNMGNN